MIELSEFLLDVFKVLINTEYVQYILTLLFICFAINIFKKL